MDRLKRSSINMIAGTAGFILPMLINFVSTPLLLSALGEAAFGLQNLVNVVIGYFIIMDFAMGWSIIKYIAEDHAIGDTESESRLLNTTMQLFWAVGMVGMAVIMLSADLLARRVFLIPSELVAQATSVFLLTGVGFLGNILFSWGRSVMIGLQRIDQANLIGVITTSTGIGLGLVSVYAGYGVVGYVFFRVVVFLLSGVICFFMVRRLVPAFRLRLHWGVDMTVLRRIGSYMRYGLLSRLLGMLSGGLDRTLIGIWLGVAAVAVYAVPFLVINSIGRLLDNMLKFIFPISSELYSTKQTKLLRNIFIRTTRFLAALSTMIFVPLLVLGDRFLSLWVGPSLAMQSSAVFYLLLAAGYIGTLSVTLVNQVMIGIGHVRVFTIANIIRTLFFSALCFLLIRPLGIIGAGVAMLLSGVVNIIFCLISLRFYLNISLTVIFREAYLRPLLLGLVLASLAFLARPVSSSWIGLCTVGIGLELFYIVAGNLVGVFGETERRAVIGLWDLLRNKEQKV